MVDSDEPPHFKQIMSTLARFIPYLEQGMVPFSFVAATLVAGTPFEELD